MVLSYYIIKFPYKLTWYLLNIAGKTDQVVFYCGNEIDINIFKPVQKYLKPLPVVVKNKKLKKKLKRLGIESTCLPVFPKAVITCRQAAYRFPEEKILKFGMRHGPYHFKPFANSRGYNMYTRFFMTSTHEMKEAETVGIKSAEGIGYPKMDSAFDGTYDGEYLGKLKRRIGIKTHKKTLFFTATWDKSGISAIDRWYDKLEQFTDEFNVLVTVHPSTTEFYKDRIKKTKGIWFIEDYNVIPYIMIADICIGDTSSILAECCALKKNMITFKVPDGKRTVPEVMTIIRSISFRIKEIDELRDAIAYALQHPDEKKKEIESANIIFFDKVDAYAGKRMADAILRYLPELRK